MRDAQAHLNERSRPPGTAHGGEEPQDVGEAPEVNNAMKSMIAALAVAALTVPAGTATANQHTSSQGEARKSAAQTASACQTASCNRRVAARQARASARWCKRNRACRVRVAQRRQLAALLPYPGPGGTRWAIPYGIVACESGGRWGAYNPSGASGPYQLLGKGAPMPANTPATRFIHHRIAARLWNGGRGRSHWVCKG